MKIITKKKISQKFKRYDITVSKNDNFVAEGVVVHNSNNRFVWSIVLGVFGFGFRTCWMKDGSMYNRATKLYPGIIDFCKDNPGHIIYGEIFGMQGNLYNYGLPPKIYDFAAFDIRKPDFQFLDYTDFLSCCSKYEIPIVKELYRGQFTNLEFLKQFAEGQSTFCDKTPREGCVVKTVKERKAESGDRLIFKIIGSGYNG